MCLNFGGRAHGQPALMEQLADLALALEDTRRCRPKTPSYRQALSTGKRRTPRRTTTMSLTTPPTSPFKSRSVLEAL